MLGKMGRLGMLILSELESEEEGWVGLGIGGRGMGWYGMVCMAYGMGFLRIRLMDESMGEDAGEGNVSEYDYSTLLIFTPTRQVYGRERDARSFDRSI